MNSSLVRSASVSPFAIYLAVVRVLSLVITFITGLWCERAGAAGNIDIAPVLSVVHGVSGLLFATLVVYHIWCRRRWFADLLAEPGCWMQQAQHHVLTLCMALLASVVVSGIAIASGIVLSLAFHIGAGMMLCIVAIVHTVLNIMRRFR